MKTITKAIRNLNLKSKFNFDKVVKTHAEALKGLKDGHKVLIGGFGLCGVPENLI